MQAFTDVPAVKPKKPALLPQIWLGIKWGVLIGMSFDIIVAIVALFTLVDFWAAVITVLFGAFLYLSIRIGHDFYENGSPRLRE